MPGVCPRCLREVYFAEEKLALGKAWHTFCFTCRNCRKLLDSCTLATNAGEIFCRNCYSRLFSATSCPLLPVSTPGKQEIIPKAKKRETLPLKNSTSDYFSDCCCCYCSEEYPVLSNKEDISNLCDCSLEKRRFRGGGEQEETFHLEVRNKCCKRENSHLGGVNSIITVSNSQKKSATSGHWFNHHQSASQSTFCCQSCPKSQVVCPSNNPSTGIPEVCRRFNNISNNNSQSGLRRPGSLCRFSNRELYQEKIYPPHNQFSEDKISKADELGSNLKPPAAVRRGVSFSNNIFEENTTCYDQECHLTMRNIADDDILKEEHRSYYKLDFEDNNFCDCNEEAEENDRLEFINRTSTSLETIQEDYCNGRMRGGCRSGGGGGGKSRYEGDRDRDYDHEGELDAGRSSGCGSSSGSVSCGCSSRSVKKQPPKSSGVYNSANPLPSPCSGKKGCCSSSGSRPLCIKKPRCPQPCGGSNQCGSGGCCGGGCRGGCGKPGQQCLPLKSCSNLPCQPRKNAGVSPCLPPRPNTRELPCCKAPQTMRITGNKTQKSGERSKSVKECHTGGDEYSSNLEGRNTSRDRYSSQENNVDNDDFSMPKLSSGCECFGGGMDCQRCGRKVYLAEMQVASGVPFHNICFSCFCCRKPLESLTYQENCGEIYCKQCYIRHFGPQGYGYGIGPGTLQTPL